MIGNAVRLISDKARASGLIDIALLRFATVGAITTAIDLILFGMLAVSWGVPVIAANAASYSCGIITSFLLNRFWTFVAHVSDGAVMRYGARFLLSNLAGLVLSVLLVALLALLLPPLLAKMISVPLIFVWNYLLARLWVFN